MCVPTNRPGNALNWSEVHRITATDIIRVAFLTSIAEAMFVSVALLVLITASLSASKKRAKRARRALRVLVGIYRRRR